jgi:deazaflavin-dependent oxidoreductase (nitroreductase family)
MAESQRNEPYVEPPREEIPKISRMHVEAMESTDADEVWVGAGMKQLILRTVGRKSGKEHKVALPYWVDDAGNKTVVASFAGAEKHPHWYLNLADRDSNPEILVRTREGSQWAEPEILEGDEYQRVWDALTADREFYKEYQTRTERRIPLVRLHDRRPA